MLFSCLLPEWLKKAFSRPEANGNATRSAASQTTKPLWQKQTGLTVVEVAVAVTILALFGIGGVDALLSLNRNATGTRAIAAAREVVQRNMETAMTVPFSTSSIPPILVATGGIGWNETADVSLGSAQIPLIMARDGTVILSGTLKRTVATIAGTSYHPDTRRVTFSLTYSINGRLKPDYTLTSIRSPDK